MPDAGGSPEAQPAPRRARDLSLRDRILALRDRLIAKPGFQRFASRFFLTRPLVRADAGALFDLTAGFVYTQILDACVRLGLFDRLADGPVETTTLAAEANIPEPEMDRLLLAAEALRLVSRRSNGRWGLGRLGAAVNGTPGLHEMIRHHRLLYDDMRDPIALLRSEGRGAALNRYWTYAQNGNSAELNASQVAEYSTLMAVSQRMLSDDILDAIRIERMDNLLDVGGGEGAFVIRAAERSRGCRLGLFDLPAVADLAKKRAEAAGQANRIATFGGSFTEDELPSGFDTISLIRVLYDHDDEMVARILQKAHASLPNGGTLIVAEPMDGTGDQARVGAAYFGFYLLAMRGGRARSPQRLRDLLADAGFDSIRTRTTAKPMLVRVMTANAIKNRDG
ncbi:MAG: methyltransferase [Pseudomonadota bacterium]